MNIGSVLFNNSALFVCMSPNVSYVNLWFVYTPEMAPKAALPIRLRQGVRQVFLDFPKTQWSPCESLRRRAYEVCE